MNKLDNFGPIYIINLEKKKDRKRYMQQQLTKFNIKNFKFFKAIDGNKVDFTKLIYHKDQIPLSNGELGCTISHLKALEHWLKNSNSEYVIVCEDDLSFETVDYWPYSWSDYLEEINENVNYDIIQFTIIDNNKVDTTFHKRRIDEWSTSCYLIKRSAAKKLIERHKKNDKYLLYLSRYSVADALIYKDFECYSVPLFTYNNQFESSINPDHLLNSHERSRKEVLEFWKNLTI